jgi:serine phosphatase RsbU (regulator of sigma subunit)
MIISQSGAVAKGERGWRVSNGALAHSVDAPARRILLVEDDDGDAFLVRELLNEGASGVDVVWVRSLVEARSTFDDSFDCVLIDLGLPDASGLEALQQVLADVADTAVIVLTGLATDGTGTAAVAAGAQDYLIKGSVDGQLLARSIRYAVERKRADNQLRRLYAAELLAAENERLERGLLPQPVTSDPRVAVVTRYRSGREGVLGGDFFDVVETSDGRLHILVGDVSGHGPDEAALGVALRISWRTLVLAGVCADDVLPILADLVVRERGFDEVFATVCMAVIDADRASGRLFLAGHPAPLLLEPRSPDGSIAQLPDDLVGPALGMLPGVTWGSQTVTLGESWRLMFFSDGLVEGRIGLGSERLGVERLMDIAAQFGHQADSAALVDHLIGRARELHGGDLVDDVAVVVVECHP